MNTGVKTRAELDEMLELLEQELPDLLAHSREDKLLSALAETRSLLETSACAKNLGYVRGRIDWMLARAGLIADPKPLRRLH